MELYEEFTFHWCLPWWILSVFRHQQSHIQNPLRIKKDFNALSVASGAWIE
ncbi:Uncharacterized protein BM_BM13110 [Brugia malayi]|uniref:Bm13110 n=1 Tax=Brugia malayi TaxID=6279 RepID=A0A0J9XV93_BRUMA|nr:Uncharacterized protein BM_BM13110 [Brugia malayi]CDP96434.1 Bm13110 [Brugia malayi]VIO98291.1 Uncharacterized protein BM_BM13110 [Brugia malayi]